MQAVTRYVKRINRALPCLHYCPQTSFGSCVKMEHGTWNYATDYWWRCSSHGPRRCWLIRDSPSEQSPPSCRPARRRQAAAAAEGASSGTRPHHWWSIGGVAVVKTAVLTAVWPAAWCQTCKRWPDSPPSSWWRRLSAKLSTNGHHRQDDVQRHQGTPTSSSSSSSSSSKITMQLVDNNYN